MRHCRKCLLPQAVSGADLDEESVCRFCREPSLKSPITPDPVQREDLEKTLSSIKNRSSSGYDCLVPLSGGKDSLYLLYKLKKEYGLKVLACTSNINLPEIAWDNIRRTLDKIHVDHIIFSQDKEFTRKLFRYLLQNQEERGAVYTISYVYAPLFEGAAIRFAIEESIPVILAGYSPGQPKPQRMRYEFNPRLISEEDWTPPHLKECGHFTPEELGRFYNPQTLPAGTQFPRYLAPFHVWDYDQNEVMKIVTREGLVQNSRHASPVFSNYPINWLLMYSDLKHFGYNPYTPEFSALIREGKASLGYWRVMAPIVDGMIRHKIFMGAEVSRMMKWLDLKDDDLKISLPRESYDPLILRTGPHA